MDDNWIVRCAEARAEVSTLSRQVAVMREELREANERAALAEASEDRLAALVATLVRAVCP